jgi:hypothetical protein
MDPPPGFSTQGPVSVTALALILGCIGCIGCIGCNTLDQGFLTWGTRPTVGSQGLAGGTPAFLVIINMENSICFDLVYCRGDATYKFSGLGGQRRKKVGNPCCR